MELDRVQRPALEAAWVKYGGALNVSDGNGKDNFTREKITSHLRISWGWVMETPETEKSMILPRFQF